MKRGDVLLAMNGKSYALHYGWPEVEKLVNEYGQEFDSVVASASATYDMPVLATTLSIGLETNYPNIFQIKTYYLQKKITKLNKTTYIIT